MKGRVYIVCVFLAIQACVHELPFPEQNPGGGNNNGGGTTTACDPDTVYFKNVILPLINSTCGKSGCHGTFNRGAFAMVDYSQITNRIGTATKFSEALNGMQEKKFENPALDYIPPTTNQIALINTWINQGARNNGCTSCDTTQFTYSGVIAPILRTYCLGCHTGATASAGIDLSTYVGVQTAALNGQLLGSITWVSPYTGTKQMPQGGSKLQDCNITQVRKWIESGALNN